MRAAAAAPGLVALLSCCRSTSGFTVARRALLAKSGKNYALRSLEIRSSLLVDECATETATTSRRNVFLLAATSAALATQAWHLPASTKNAAPQLQLFSIPNVIQWIDHFCDRRFLHAVVASDYRFLYRGVPPNDPPSTAMLRSEAPDLLSLDTYGSTGALQFFQDLETTLRRDAVRPSNGHLATTSVGDATLWGNAASIWPMGQAAHYAWFHDGGSFYPRNTNVDVDRNSIIVDGRDCGKDSLEDALRSDSCEILVATTSFLAVPVSMEKELREGLKKSFLV